MIYKTKTCALFGINGYIVDVEVDLSNGLPGFDIVGLPDTAVKESRERVRAAIKNSEYQFPHKRITINLAPADIKKEGSNFDLAIAVGILNATMNITNEHITDMGFLGELSLDGKVKGINGVLPMCMALVKNGISKVMLSKENAEEAALIQGLDVYAIEDLKEMVSFFTKEISLKPYYVDIEKYFVDLNNIDFDFKDVKGQVMVKRALEITAAGGHNVIMIGPPGSGKTMLARRLPSILPEMSFQECLEVTKIYSITGLLKDKSSLVTKRPFRSPHHTMSGASLIGGGRIPKPGEVSLAHFGVLFLDEMPEFPKHVLEVLRQPLEDECVTISRVNGSVTYPAKFILVASVNPCPCGYLGDESGKCNCTGKQVKNYIGKISGPLLDRIDLHVEVVPVKFNDITSKQETESSIDIKKRISKARKMQLQRYKDEGIYFNSQLKPRHMDLFCSIGAGEKELLKKAFDRFNLSARAYNRILKVSRTIADLDESENITTKHIAEAIQHRCLDRKYTI